MPRSSRNLTLDLLRAVAVLLVLGRHMPPLPSHLRNAFCNAWVCGGWVGVDLFFVLSGFLVSGLLFQEYRQHGRLSVGRFLIRRGFKIYPCFYVLLFACLLTDYLRTGQVVARRSLIAEVCFLQNYLPGYWAHSWSLAVEEHFYLLMPLLLLGLAWTRRRSANPFSCIVPMFLVLATATLGLRIALAATSRFSLQAHYFPTHLRFDSLMMGVVVAYAYHVHRSWWESVLVRRRGWLVLAGLALLSPAFWVNLQHPFIWSAGFTFFYLGSAALLIGMLSIHVPSNRGTRAVALLGTYSYTIYLVHIPWRLALPWCEQTLNLELDPMLRLGIYLGGSIAGGILFAKAVETPFLAWRDRWFPSPQIMTTPTPASTMARSQSTEGRVAA